ncbi:MAG: shikimate kinase [Pseudobdellovibrio sp.]
MTELSAIFKKLIIGHRGVGKTNFLKRHESYFKQAGLNIPHFDLDQEIERLKNDSIQNIFNLNGEVNFRTLEIDTYNKLIKENKSYVISLGAGFNLSHASDDQDILFINRITDKNGRIFLNRPRLNSNLSPLEEYQKRYLARNESYFNKATQIYTMPEGLQEENDVEKAIILNSTYIEDGIYTLVEKEIQSLDFLIAKYKNIELRTDLIPIDKINKIVKENVNQKWLIAIRTEQSINRYNNAIYDFDVNLMKAPDFLFENSENIISCHLSNLTEAILKTKDFKNIQIKLSPEVESFEDLIKGHEWQQANPGERSFLPRSKGGKWVWFRQISKYLQKINFVRNFTLISDQPSEYQWLSLPQQKPISFGAVLGAPILFSRSPEIHKKYFEKMNSFFTAIELNEDEFAKHIHWLNKIGLAYAAVTSPLKKVAFDFAEVNENKSIQYKSANTLHFKKNALFATNTDWFGFQELVKENITDINCDIVVWGGGGTLNMMQSVLPNAIYISSQTGQLRKDSVEKNINSLVNPIIIWAAPRTDQTHLPPDSWNPKLIIDLNYTENSMGLEYAEKYKLKYISGLKMFTAQALEQQKYWSLS